jgi:hypothetical protein
MGTLLTSLRFGSVPSRWLLSCCFVLLASTWAGVARAQASSWLYLGGGASVVDSGERDDYPLIQIDTGLGTSAKHPLVVGGIFRMQSYLSGGADLGVLARVVSRGFAKGDYGLGLDVGVSQRFWGVHATQFTADLVLGAPWGLTCILGAALDGDVQQGYFVSLGFDFARLTVHRHTGLDWFANPMRSPGD